METSIAVVLDGGEPKRLWASPREPADLALGHCLLEMCPPGFLPVPAESDGTTFRFTTVQAALPPPVAWPGPLAAGDILAAAHDFSTMDGLWESTGCFHRMAVLDPATKAFLHCEEDIGRHNCLDRLAGWAVRTWRPLAGLVLYGSARATASLVVKAVKSGYAVFISRSAVTSAAVELARDAGMTLLGFSRDNRFTVFCDPGKRLDTMP